MTAKEYLGRLRSLEMRVSANAKEIESLNELATHITSAINSDGIHVTGSTSDKLGNCVTRIIDLQRAIDSDIIVLEGLRGEIISQIDNVRNDKHRELLRMRYVSGMTFEEIAVEMDMSWRHIIRLHGYALKEFAEKNSEIFKKGQNL